MEDVAKIAGVDIDTDEGIDYEQFLITCQNQGKSIDKNEKGSK